MKDSGYGKEAGIESIKDYTRIKRLGLIHLTSQWMILLPWVNLKNWFLTKNSFFLGQVV